MIFISSLETSNMKLRCIMKKRSDVLLLRGVINFFGLSCTFPIIDKKFWILQVSVQTIFCSCWFAGCPLFIYDYVIELLQNYNVSVLRPVMECSRVFTLIAINWFCVKSWWCDKPTWKNLFNVIEDFDATMQKYTAPTQENVMIYYFKIIVQNLLLVGLLSWAEFSTFDYDIRISFIYISFIYVQIVVSAVSMSAVLKIVGKRFDCFTMGIKEIYQLTKCDGILWNENQLKVSYLQLINMVGKINKLFGGRILVVLIFIFFDLLSASVHSFLRNEFKGQFSFHSKSVVLLYMFLVTVSKYFRIEPIPFFLVLFYILYEAILNV